MAFSILRHRSLSSVFDTTQFTKRHIYSTFYANAQLRRFSFHSNNDYIRVSFEMMYFRPLLTGIIVLVFLSFADLQSLGGYYTMYSYGQRLVVLVAFDSNYTFTNFMTNLRQFANALQCPYRHQFITFYFGDQSMQIDCDYQMNLVECVNARFVENMTTAFDAYEVVE